VSVLCIPKCGIYMEICMIIMPGLSLSLNLALFVHWGIFIKL
jgi:uncharacterized protein YlaN (UPF0358 family)